MTKFQRPSEGYLQLWLLLLLSAFTLAASEANTLIHQYANGTWIEALSVRSNGLILATDASSPKLYSVNPFHGSSELVFEFPDATGAVGITEVRPDVFMVVVGNFSLKTYLGETGSFSLWEIDYSCHSMSYPTVTKYMDFPEAKFADGLTSLPGTNNIILCADLNLGLVFRIDLIERVAEIGITGPLFGPGSTVIGVDGLKIYNNTLYFTNPGQELIGQIPINPTGQATGPAKVTLPIGGDDFAVDGHGELFNVGGSNILTKVDLVTLKGQNLTTLPGPTACQFGRSANDSACLYVTTSGGDADYAEIPILVGGGIYSVDVYRNGSCPHL